MCRRSAPGLSSETCKVASPRNRWRPTWSRPSPPAPERPSLNLLTQVANQSKQVVASQYLGATRDILATLDRVRAGYLHSHRIPRTASFTAILPDWGRDVIRADMLREIGHDNAGSRDVMAITDAEIDAWFKARNVNVIWTIDALEAGTYGTGGEAIPAQYFPIATAGAQPTWPGQSTGPNHPFTMAWFLFVEGSFQFLDGGRLDLGVVRDSLLDSTNDYEVFAEVFEGVAFRGLECYQIQQSVFRAGGSAGRWPSPATKNDLKRLA